MDAPLLDSTQYIEPLRQLFQEIMRESWMDDQDWKEVEQMLFNEIGTSYSMMAEQVAVGVGNGVSAEVQYAAIRIAAERLKKEYDNNQQLDRPPVS